MVNHLPSLDATSLCSHSPDSNNFPHLSWVCPFSQSQKKKYWCSICNPNTRCWSGLIRHNCQLLSPLGQFLHFCQILRTKDRYVAMSLHQSNSVTFFCQWIPGYLSFPPNLWGLVRISCRWWGWVLVFGGVVKGWAGCFCLKTNEQGYWWKAGFSEGKKNNLHWVLQFHRVLNVFF